ncbi:Inorganic diphosphatase [Ignisphaera aggregans DSM 17230]|uniref:K(+)-insensitive pyrophosphate-energized proton pump n=1 Tax=Ignisphaera aggregans (strain DSM 17230 / JCM 13409 / AQ1.S1) TaxID=583356 RepID=E0STJ7_IGNAA|nr:Inorganic diphosphatase [Ignisphaera aggregans DSM 17230]
MSEILRISIYTGLLAGVVALFYTLLLIYDILRRSIPLNTENEKRAKEIHGYIYSAAKAYIFSQYKVILIVISIITVVLIGSGALLGNSILLLTGITYILGGISSTIVGIVGMLMAIQSNIRVLNTLSRKDLRSALTLAFRGGSVTGFLVGGIGLTLISILFVALNRFNDPATAGQILLGYAFGASTVALFARVGGGIYTKAADIGADLVGKVEAGIPEDDPRNPGVIADNVGDNVGDCAGMGADLFESYVEGIIAPMVIATLLSNDLVAYPVLFSAIALLTSIITSQFVATSPFSEPGRTLTFTSVLTIAIAALLNGVITLWIQPQIMAAWVIGVLGLIVGAIVGFTSDYFTSPLYRPVKIVATNSQFGPALTILSGLSMGFYSVFIPSVAIALAIIASFSIGSGLSPSENLLAGIYSAALAGTGMLSVAPIIVAADAYGPIVDNVAGLAEQAGYEEEIRDLADKLDSAGNTMKSISKGYAIGSAALTALALLFSFASVLAHRTGKSISDIMAIVFNAGHKSYGVYFIGGVIIGAVLVPFFVAMVIQAVTAAAGKLVDEIRRQFREKPGILEWKERPDYERAVRIVTYYAIRRLVAPGLLAILFPLALGAIFAIGDVWRGTAIVGGLLIGSIASGLLLGLFQGNVGNTWDNAKKYIEAGNLGGKGTDTHKAAVVGDTVGDPLKDASGPAINIMIKVMAVASTVILPYILFI